MKKMVNKKIIYVILVVTIISNLILPSFSHATDITVEYTYQDSSYDEIYSELQKYMADQLVTTGDIATNEDFKAYINEYTQTVMEFIELYERFESNFYNNVGEYIRDDINALDVAKYEKYFGPFGRDLINVFQQDIQGNSIDSEKVDYINLAYVVFATLTTDYLCKYYEGAWGIGEAGPGFVTYYDLTSEDLQMKNVTIENSTVVVKDENGNTIEEIGRLDTTVNATIIYNGTLPPEDSPEDSPDNPSDDSSDEESDEESPNVGKKILGFIDWAFGILLIPFKILALVPAFIAQAILSAVVSGGEGSLVWVTIEQILFNEIDIINIDIFSTPSTEGNEIITGIRTSIANWYVAFRNLVIVIYLCSLIYIGIRMAMSSIAEDKAKYKDMLKNWFVGLCLVFVLHYIITFIIQANNFLIATIQPQTPSGDNESFMNTLLEHCFLEKFTTSLGSISMYTILTILTFIFFIIYVKRMVTVNFLITIAPLITLTYPIDRVKDNRSQILNSWLKEFISDVLIQFFHCLIYVVLVQTSIDNMLNAGPANFAAIFVSIVFTCCIFYVEGIVKKLFGLDQGGSTFLQNVAMGSVLTNVYSNVKSIKGSKNDEQASATAQTPDTLPNGQNVSEALAQMPKDEKKEEKIPGNLQKKAEHQENNNFFTQEAKNQGKNSGTKKQNGKKNIVTTAASGYGKLLGKMAEYTVPFYSSAKGKVKRRYDMSLKDTEKLFQLAMRTYIEDKDPNMSQEQVRNTIEVLHNTNIKDLAPTTPEHNVKLWMLHMQKNYKDAGIAQPEAMLRKTITSFEKNYFKSKQNTNI